MVTFHMTVMIISMPSNYVDRGQENKVKFLVNLKQS